MVDVLINNKNFPDLAWILDKDSSDHGFKGSALSSDPKLNQQWSVEKHCYCLHPCLTDRKQAAVIVATTVIVATFPDSSSFL